MKTADLQRSKRLKELGWEQETLFVHLLLEYGVETGMKHNWVIKLREYLDARPNNPKEAFSAPQAGEMIEWLLGKNFIVIFGQFGVYLEFEGRKINCFSGQYGNENALADACAWVLERKK